MYLKKERVHMPNHCSNRLTVTGAPDALKKFVEFAKPDPDSETVRPDQPLDYDKLCPMPDEKMQQFLESQGSAYTRMAALIVGGGTPLEQFKNMQASEDPEERKKAEHLLHEAWYGWRIGEWGTKWNCYDGYVDVGDIDEGRVVYDFDSAWSPPVGVVRAAAEHFDTLTFRLEYAEGGSDFAGVFEAIGDAYTDECEDNVLSTDYGREMYEESTIAAAEEAREWEEEEEARLAKEVERAKDQNNRGA